jgi:hypothetical protein
MPMSEIQAVQGDSLVLSLGNTGPERDQCDDSEETINEAIETEKDKKERDTDLEETKNLPNAFTITSSVLTKEFLEWNMNKEKVENSRKKLVRKGTHNQITKNALTTSDAGGSKRSRLALLLSAYESMEETVLDKLEVVLSYMDNFVAFQALFPSLELRTKNMKMFKPLNFLIRQIARIYIVMILIYLKRYLLRLRKINKLIKLVKIEFSIIRNNFVINKRMNANGRDMTEYHEKCLRVLYVEKFKALVEIIGYFNDLVLNLSLVTKRVILGKVVGRFVGFVSWVVNLYRLCKDEKEETKNDIVIKEMELRFGV